ncbi:hypothetical protein [Nocardia sp. NPDC003963]
MNAPIDPTRVRGSHRDLWNAWHAACEQEPTFACSGEADFVRRQHGGHGPECIQLTAALAYLSGLTDDADHEYNPAW